MSGDAEAPRRARPKTARQLGIMQGFPPPPEKRPTLRNWDLPPFNRWSFQNVRSLFPTVNVARGTGPVRALPSAPRDLSGLRFRAGDGPTTLSRFLEDSYTDGFLVMHRGKLVEERYFNDMTPDTPHLSQSVAKSVVGVALGRMHGRGEVDLSAPLADIVPELSRCGYADATLNQALDMQTGVRFTEDYGQPDSDMTRIDVAAGWRPAPRGGARPTIRDVILTLPKIRPHGEVFEYRSIETDVIAWAMERIAGLPLAQIVSREVWSLIGAEHDASFTVDGAATALADGGFNATLRDYARFGLMMLEDGRVEGRQVLPAAWVASCRTGETDKYTPSNPDVSPNGAYSRQWWVRDVDRGDFAAKGVFGQMIYVDPSSDLLVVKFSTWPDYLMPGLDADTYAAVDAIREALS